MIRWILLLILVFSYPAGIGLGEDETEYANSIQQTRDGGYIVAGVIYGKEEKGWLIKLDSSGKEEWNKTYASSSFQHVQEALEGYIITGRTSNFDVLLIKTNLYGKEEWNITLESENVSCGKYVLQTNDGYLVAGFTSPYALLIKVDSLGRIEWSRRFKRYTDNYFCSIIQLDEAYIIGGYTGVICRGGDYDFWLVKIDKKGNEIWNRTYGGYVSRRGGWICQASDGGYIIAGNFEPEANQHQEMQVVPSFEVEIIKTDAKGFMEWRKKIGKLTTFERCKDLKKVDDNYLLVGHICNPLKAEDVWIVKIDEKGEILWERIIGSNREERGNSICLTKDGGCMVAGGIRTPRGDMDVFLVKIPSLAITKPKGGRIYVFDEEVASTPSTTPFIMGRITIKVSPSNNDKVEFYINNKLEYVDTQPPFEWLWRRAKPGKNMIEVRAYSKEEVATHKIEVIRV